MPIFVEVHQAMVEPLAEPVVHLTNIMYVGMTKKPIL